MRLSLIFPSWTGVFGEMAKVARGASTFPPLNLAYLAAIAEKNGHTVQLIDGEAEQLGIQDIITRVNDFSPDLIGLTATTPMFHIALEQAKELKAKLDVPIVAGGPHVTHFREEIFHEYFDYFVIGQCEGTFGNFLSVIENNGDMGGVPGLLYRKNKEILFSGENPQMVDLDEIPFPARHLLKKDKYRVGTMKGKKIYTSIMASRGCPFKCVFCSTSIYGKKVRRRSLQNLIAEIEHLIKGHRINHFYFLDDTLTLNRRYILELCDEIEKRGLQFTWEGGTRANLVDEELISRMAECGLIRISFGFESADLKVRDIIKKEVPIESYESANKLTNKYDIETINSVMLGLPGDTYETIEKTIKFIRNSQTIKHATFGIAIPYPGSEMFEMALNKQHGLKLETQDFSKYQRYNSAVMTVNGISPEKMRRLQKKGLLRIYLVPWRIIPVLKRFGIRSLIKPFINALRGS
jgi:anaerobic magnesium-protoporphyrin IX monomethyl ester cyclase